MPPCSTRFSSVCSTRGGLLVGLLMATLLLVSVAPSAHAGETVAVNADRSFLAVTLDDVLLDTTAITGTSSAVTVNAQRCTVQGGGVTVIGSTAPPATDVSTVTINFLDTRVVDTPMTFFGYLPTNSLVRIVNLTADMEGSTTLFDMASFGTNNGVSFRAERVSATWHSSPGGTVITAGNKDYMLLSTADQLFHFSEAVLIGAQHFLEIASTSTSTYPFNSNYGLTALEFISFLDARGSFMFLGDRNQGLATSLDGMMRLNNITMTGGQPFIECNVASGFGIRFSSNGTMSFSGITSDGPFFLIPRNATFVGRLDNVKFSLRHINVPKMVLPDSYPHTIPSKSTDSNLASTRAFIMGNITVAGVLLDSIAALESVKLYPSQVVGAYGEALAMRGSPWMSTAIGAATGAYCHVLRDAPIFVPLVPGVQRAECGCASGYYGPYCTTVVDPIVYYDGYSPTPAACGVAHCDRCLFGQTGECGGCEAGYGLTPSLQCELPTCVAAHCTSCAFPSDTVCAVCESGYEVDPQGTGACVRKVCRAAHCTACVWDSSSVCYACADGYTLSASGDGSCEVPHCGVAHCEACVPGQMDVCGTCEGAYVAQQSGEVCVLFPCGVPGCERCDPNDANTCVQCAEGLTLSEDGTGSCAARECAVAHCKACVAGAPYRCDTCESGYWFDRNGGCTVCRAGYARSGSACVRETPVLTILLTVITAVQCVLILFAFFLGWCVCRRWRRDDEHDARELSALLTAQAGGPRPLHADDSRRDDWSSAASVLDTASDAPATGLPVRRRVAPQHVDPLVVEPAVPSAGAAPAEMNAEAVDETVPTVRRRRRGVRANLENPLLDPTDAPPTAQALPTKPAVSNEAEIEF